MATKKIESTSEAWESGQLGATEAYVEVADPAHADALDEALELQSISIRLPKQMVSQYKLIAHFHGVGYQPLMRDVLARFVPSALKEILEEEQQRALQAAALATKGAPGSETKLRHAA